jgi:16S rRNA (uracil1498-N3)-methyltransferase
MELFYSRDIEGGVCRLDHDESGHCIKVLRHRAGDEISVIDGCGTLYRCRITSDSHKGVEAMVLDSVENWGSHPYHLHMAVCPTKNNDRYEWFVEKATECGVDRIVPMLCAHSEHKVVKEERLEKIAVSAMKQSLKAYLPVVEQLTPFASVIAEPFDGVKLIAHCEEDMERIFLGDVVAKGDNVMLLIGPEGDFSPEEIAAARAAGFREVTLGGSRLRTETAALASAMYVAYINNL